MAAVKNQTFDGGHSGALPTMNELQISGVYNAFMAHFNQDWSKKSSHFSDPIHRAQTCSRMIEELVKNGCIDLANVLHALCQKKKAWNANVGIQSQNTDQRKVERICARALGVATHVLPILEETEESLSVEDVEFEMKS